MMQGKEKWKEDLRSAYFELYSDLGGSGRSFDSLMQVIEKRGKERGKELKALDMREHDWYMSEQMVGMMLYVDLFAGTIKGMIDKIPYLVELGITYVHLMPLLKPREKENDGGYAVEDYMDIDPKLGRLEDFVMLMDALRHAGIAVCIDYVLNHTSDTHEWAKKALEGDKNYQDMYMMYDSRDIPDLYDATVPEVLPDKHPGNFTYKMEIDKWVYTSFSDFQWDLNFKNPVVFEKMVDIMLYLANLGVNIIRLDAIAFVWKEIHTSCRNLNQAHKLMHMLHCVKEIACPSLALLGEAIVEPDEIFKYFGTRDYVECGILYNANFMVNIFNSMATRDVRLMKIDNERFNVPVTGCFMNYIRCHDDIGWGFNEDATRQLGLDPYQHKHFLINFYSRDFEGSFAKGEIYQYNPKNHDARTNGTLASLLGLEQARDMKDTHGRIFALNRIKLVTALIFSHRGIPLIYSGDELATINDQSYLKDPHKSKEGRWVHRPYFDWLRAERRKDPFTDEGVIFLYTQNMIRIRKHEPLLNGKIEAQVIDINHNQVYTFYKEDGGKRLLCLYNFSENNQYISSKILRNRGFSGFMSDLLTGKMVSLETGEVHLYPYECLWLKETKTHNT